MGNVTPHECQYIAVLKRWAVFHFHCHTWRSCCISQPLLLRLLKDHCSVRSYEQWVRAMWKLSLVMINPLYRVSAPDSAVSLTCVEPFQLSAFGLLASACVLINNALWSWFVNKSQSLLLTSMHCEYPWDLTNMLTVFTKPFLPPLRELFSPLLAHSLICLFVCLSVLNWFTPNMVQWWGAGQRGTFGFSNYEFAESGADSDNNLGRDCLLLVGGTVYALVNATSATRA